MTAPALLALLVVASPVDTLTVLQCAELAALHAPDVRTAHAEALAASYDSSAAAVNGRPALSLDGGALVAPNGFYDPAATNLGEYHAKVVLDWPLADGGARRRERLTASLTAEGARFDAAKAARDAQLRAIELALDLVRTDETRAAQASAEAWIDELKPLVDAGVRSGRRGRADAVRVDLEHDAAESAQLTSEGARGAIARELATLIGRPGQVVAVRRPDGELVPADSAALLARLEAQPELRAAQNDEALKRIAIEEAKSKRALELGFVADAGLWGTDLTHTVPPDLLAADPNANFGDRIARDLGASVAIEIKKPLNAAGAQASALARVASLDAASSRRQALIEERRRGIFDLVERGRTAAAQLELAEASVGRAEDNVLRARSLYAGGGAGLLDLLDARRTLDEARARLADARFEAWKAVYEAEVL